MKAVEPYQPRGERPSAPVEKPYVEAPDDLRSHEELHLRSLLTIVRRRKFTITSFVLISLLGVGALLHLERPRYRARAVIRLEDTQRAMAGGLGVIAADGA